MCHVSVHNYIHLACLWKLWQSTMPLPCPRLKEPSSGLCLSVFTNQPAAVWTRGTTWTSLTRECVWILSQNFPDAIHQVRMSALLISNGWNDSLCILHHIALIPFLCATTWRGILQQNSVVLCLGRLNSTYFTFDYMSIVCSIYVCASDDVYAAILLIVNDPRLILKLIMYVRRFGGSSDCTST